MALTYTERISRATDQAAMSLKEGAQFINAVAEASKEYDVEFREVQAQLTERSAIRRANIARYKAEEANQIKLYDRRGPIDVDGDVLPPLDVTSVPIYTMAKAAGFPYLSYECPYVDGDDEELLVTVIPGTERVWKNATLRICRQNHPMELTIVCSALKRILEQRKAEGI